MIFDSCAHQLAKDDLSIYLNKILSELVKSFPNQVGYYAKDGVSYDHIFAASDNYEVPFAGIGVDSNVSIQDIFAKRNDGSSKAISVKKSSLRISTNLIKL